MLTGKDYCDYETSRSLKELGYKVPTSAYYMPNNRELFFVSNPFRGGYAIDCFYSHNSFEPPIMGHNYIDAPTMWEAQKWLREENDIQIEVPISFKDKSVWKFSFRLQTREFYYKAIGEWDTYEEALSKGVKCAVKILKEE